MIEGGQELADLIIDGAQIEVILPVGELLAGEERLRVADTHKKWLVPMYSQPWDRSGVDFPRAGGASMTYSGMAYSRIDIKLRTVSEPMPPPPHVVKSASGIPG
jgi:hypothetical protein